MVHLLGLNNIVSHGHRVPYDSDIVDQYVLHVRDDKKIVQCEILFPVSEHCLYVKEKVAEMDTRHNGKDKSKASKVPVLILKQKKKNVKKGTVLLNRVEGYTRREVLRTKRCRKLLHNISAPSYVDLQKLIRMNLMKNCPVGCEDVKLVQEIFDKDVAVHKRKSVRLKPNAATKNDLIN